MQAEERLVKVSTEASQAQAKIAAARAAAREAREEASASAREAALRRDETSRLKAELERSRAACAAKVGFLVCLAGFFFMKELTRRLNL